MTVDEARRILGIGSPNDDGLAKDRWKELIRRYHPDRFEHLGQEFADLAKRRTAKINAAYQRIIDRDELEDEDTSLYGDDPDDVALEHTEESEELLLDEALESLHDG